MVMKGCFVFAFTVALFVSFGSATKNLLGPNTFTTTTTITSSQDFTITIEFPKLKMMPDR